MVCENIPDPMDAEQTWPTDEEMKEATSKNKRMIKRVPQGMSVYQSAWIPDEESDHGMHNVYNSIIHIITTHIYHLYINIDLN